MTSETVKVTGLGLVYPPISNMESTWLEVIPEVEVQWRQSDFYMIGGRAEAKFKNFVKDDDTYTLYFDFCVGDKDPSPVALNIRSLPNVAENGGDTLDIELGEKFIRIHNSGDTPGVDDPLDWFTTEKLLYDRSHCKPGINGLENFCELSTFDLLYVGIAKKTDTYDRLFKRGHRNRMQILSKEPQRYPGALVSDEIYLFLFRTQELFMTTFDLEHEFSDEDMNGEYDKKQVVADAEKAFISLMRPEYNNVQYPNYPKGEDGLYKSGLKRYSYSIYENIIFNTAKGKFKGGWDGKKKFLSNAADCIMIEGDVVKFHPADELNNGDQ